MGTVVTSHQTKPLEQCVCSTGFTNLSLTLCVMKKIVAFIFLCLSAQLSFAQNQMPLVSSLYYPDGLSSLWGYVDPTGHEYALVGVKSGTSIVDIENPVTPTELFFIPGPFNNWREIKTWQQYAYVSNEVGEGIQIIDLGNLPNAAPTINFTADGMLKSVHALWIDEFGYLYLAGFNNMASDIPVEQRGVAIFDLNADPLNPTYVNTYSNNYVHDAYVRDNIMYTSEIYAGQVAIIDITDKQNMVTLATQTTPNAFAHNVWLSDNSHYMFVADEKNGAFVTSYDISNLNDIRELDRYQSSPGSNTMPHNVHILNDFLLVSYYTDGVRILDAHQPDALIETEFYDTSPFSGPGSAGCWGVYQYLPSGNILASDRQQGLFIMRPAFQRASYVEGNVVNAQTDSPLSNVTISIVGTNANDLSRFDGSYKTGTANAGVYDIKFEKYGYSPVLISNQSLVAGQNLLLNIALEPLPSFDFSVRIMDENGAVLPNINVLVKHSPLNNQQSYALTSNAEGLVQIEDIFNDSYTIWATQWGYVSHTAQFDATLDNDFYEIVLPKGYYDNFATELNWTVEGLTDNALGAWTRQQPWGTLVNGALCAPAVDVPDDWGTACYVTGYEQQNNAESFDLDAGTTRLVSPNMNLNSYTAPYINFSLWFCATNTTAPSEASVLLYLTDGTNNHTLVSSLDTDSLMQGFSGWKYFSLPVGSSSLNYGQVRLVVEAFSAMASSIVEVGFDHFSVSEGQLVGIAPPDAAFQESEGTCQISARAALFSEKTWIDVFVAEQSVPQTVCAYNTGGVCVFKQTFEAGRHFFEFGGDLPNGIYLLRADKKTLKVMRAGK